MKVIDLRSDTVTRPSREMRAAMAAAEVGDDVLGEDPTVFRLEEEVAATLGHEAGLYVPSGTQGNLVALLTHCGRGDEYIVGQQGHTYRYEGGGGAVLGGIQPQPLDYKSDGTLDLERVAAAIKPADHHFARTRLLCLENTQAGRVLPLDYLERAERLVRERGLQFHLDGARVFNAAVKLKIPVARITGRFDSVSVCLSKGLGAPVGSVLVGSRAFVDEARRWRKVVGGGMRQSGILAAAGLYALAHNVDRLAEDHANARALAEGLSGLPGLRVDPDVQTNMVFVDLAPARVTGLAAYLKKHAILITTGRPVRMVTHLDVSAADIKRVIAMTSRFLTAESAGLSQVSRM